MNRGSPNESKEMLDKFIPLVERIKKVDMMIAPPFTALTNVYEILKNTNIKLGAQNMYCEDRGAYTGEISPKFLKEIGVEYIILGHSERRDIFNEPDTLINKKLIKALSWDFIPIVCIGEHLEERVAGKTKEIIEYQMNLTFKNLTQEQIMKTIIAYEPIWAIGTGKTATPEQAEEIHIFIRDLIIQKFDKDTANYIRIQYGGSINPDNAGDLFKKENIDGGLVGGASLEANSLYQIITAADKISK